MKNLVLKSFGVILVAAALLSTHSCNRVETPNQTANEAIGFAVDIESATGAKPAAMTMAAATVSKSAFALNDQIGLWVVPFSVTGDGASISDVFTDLRPMGNYVDNAVHTYATNFVAAKPIYYPSAKAKVDLYGVFPYDALMSDRTNNNMTDPKLFSFAVDQDQSASTGSAIVKSDFMTAFYRGAMQGANGKLTFHHRMSRVLIAFTVGAKYKDKSVIAVKSVVLCDVPRKSFINVTDTTAVPTIDPTTNAPVDITAYQAVKPLGIAGDYTYEAIVTPGTTIAAGGVIVKVTLNVQELGDVEFICKTPSIVTYAAKKQTNINVNIMDQSQIGFANVAIQGWGTPIDINASTSKLSNMIISCTAASSATINKTAVTAKLTIQGDLFDAVALYDEALSAYRLRYDQKDNFGGYLTKIEMKDAAGAPIYSVATLPAGGLRIKKDPTIDDYAEVIGTMTFQADGSVEFK